MCVVMISCQSFGSALQGRFIHVHPMPRIETMLRKQEEDNGIGKS